MNPVRIGILGTGSIAKTITRTANAMNEVAICAVASRTAEKAEAFAAEFGIPQSYGSYEELLADPAVDIVYIATPHSAHYENALLCLRHNKNVLCEKSFTQNAGQAEALVRLAAEKGLLLVEAMWTRFTPMEEKLRQVLADGVIGTPWLVTANLGYPSRGTPRISDPALAGGALLDLGVYAVNFAATVFGSAVERVQSSAVVAGGVDLQNSITLHYSGGRMAQLMSTITALTDRAGVISGERGYIVVDNISYYQSIRVYASDRTMIAEYLPPEQITGYEHELRAVAQAFRQGQTECDQMSHAETLRIMHIMDEARRQWGMRYPGEE